jgi:glyoxylase-like metal-dependent hydrolase (beta-lactamase superfamily II)
MSAGQQLEHYRIEKVGAGTWAALALPGTGASSKSGSVDVGGETLVFDTSLTPQAAKDLRTAARLLTGRDPSTVVNSHGHPAPTLGNRVFGGCSIWSTSRTRDLLEERGPAMIRAIGDPTWALRTIDL